MDPNEHPCWPGAGSVPGQSSSVHSATKQLCGILLSAGFLAAGYANPPPELAEPLRLIRAVGAEGQGNSAASAAWKTLAASEASMLLPILEAMDGSNDYALNWLRAAIESIAEREVRAGGTLPLDELGRFLLDARHHPRARRLAFELMAKVDPDTTDK